ncbi:MAG TPA: hypothetical protein VGF88_13000 [Acidobacteriaceae bacterium]
MNKEGEGEDKRAEFVEEEDGAESLGDFGEANGPGGLEKRSGRPVAASPRKVLKRTAWR